MEDEAFRGMIETLDVGVRDELYGIFTEYENGTSIEA
jgi:hypothetical protein